MVRSTLPEIKSVDVESWPAPTAVWQHSGQSGQFQVQIDLVRGSGRRDAIPDATLAYASGGGSGVFGLGWSVGLPSINRGNGRSLPRYRDLGPDADGFVASEFGELVPVLVDRAAGWVSEPFQLGTLDVARFRPRNETAFSRIERRTDSISGDVYWVTISRDNVTRVFGRTPDARIADPSDPRRVAQWLVEDQWDSLGHRIHYEYKREDFAGVSEASLPERHRLASRDRDAALHLKRIQWGNAQPFTPGDWLFEMVFDYGDERAAEWSLRPDAFSSYRMGFEVRTRRRCERVLVFHNIDRQPNLVRGYELGYESAANVSLLTSVTVRGYRHEADGATRVDSLPTVSFEYGELHPPGPVREVACSDGRASASGLASEQQWLDIDGTALPNLVSREPGGALYYRPNLGDGLLGTPVALPTRPSMTDGPRAFGQALAQPFGDNRSCLVDLETGPGYQERERTGAWLPYQPFRGAPIVRSSNAGTRSVDLDGDGRADLMLASEGGARWYPSAGRHGWKSAREVASSPSVKTGLADRTGTVLLADMTGDGLTDMVQIRPGSVRYWPNLGQGRFGEPVQMAGSPFLDGPDLFDPSRVRLFDIDGSGAADLVYFGRRAVTWYPNQAGNSFGPPQVVRNLPAVTDLDNVNVVDLLGSGTGCLVWSTGSPGRADRPMRFVELVGGERPHLMSSIISGQGVEVDISYTPSTRLMLDDNHAGRRWYTTLPTAVSVVTELRELDLANNTARVSTWSYRHGYYDDVARETRGFAYVERRESTVASDPIDPSLASPIPVRETRIWYHTGAVRDREPLAALLAREFYAGDPANRPELAIDDSVAKIPPREILRALQGRPIRQEIYDAAGGAPYKVLDHGYLVRPLQPHAGASPAAVAMFPSETVERIYETSATDPRVIQRLVTFDAYGNSTRQVTIGYPKRRLDHDEQARSIVRIDEIEVANEDTPDRVRLGVPFASRSFELGPIPAPEPGALVTSSEVAGWLASPTLVDVPFEEPLPLTGPICRRLVRATEIIYWDDALAVEAPIGEVGQRALIHHQRSAAFTDGLIAAAYQPDAVDRAALATAGYEHDRGVWWAPSPTVTFDPAAFSLPIAERDAYGAERSVRYDSQRLFVVEAHDPVGNVQRGRYDYQALAAAHVTAPNGGSVGISFDGFGLPLAIAYVGARGEGDSLAAPTTMIGRDLLAWQRDGTPVALAVTNRVRHGDPTTPWDRRVTYCDGRGKPMQTKRLAELARWVVESHVVTGSDNGSPVRSYAPGFVSDDRFTPESALSAFPLARTRSDVLGRVIETRRPDGAVTRTDRTAWSTTAWDANDSVRDSDWLRTRRRVGASSQEVAEADAAEAHAGTPSIEYVDAVGRAFLAVQDGGSAGLAATRTQLAIGGEIIAITDARGVATEQRTIDMLGRVIRIDSSASGGTRALLDVDGQVAHAWGARGQEQHYYRDPLRRLVRRELRPQGGPWRVVERLVWGEQALGVDGYLRGQLHLHYDGAGQLKSIYDFHGNPIAQERTYCEDLMTPADWTALASLDDAASVESAAAAQLTREPLTTSVDYDAQSRPISRTTPDGTVTAMEYGPRGLPSRISVATPTRRVIVLDHPSYDAAGRQLAVRLGNGVTETSSFEVSTGMLISRTTTAANGHVLRDLGISRDAVGNVLSVSDAGQQTLYFQNARVIPDRSFRYDALYRLIHAEGRESADPSPSFDRSSTPAIGPLPNPNDLAAVRRYVENYQYDRTGNLTQVEHVATPAGSWTVRYDIAADSDRVIGLRNRDGSAIPPPFEYSAAGNPNTLGALSGLVWDDDEQLARVDLGGGGTVYYAYDAGGRRAAKVIVRLGGAREQRLYLDGYEHYQHVTGAGVVDEQAASVHVQGVESRLLLVESRRAGAETSDTTLWRYQHADQVGSSCLETDRDGAILTFEEYRPFGATAYHAAVPAMLPKRYRFGGQENDAETGLNYHTARYYAPWLARWTSPDPAGMQDGTNRYWFAKANPATRSDPAGLQSAAGSEDRRLPSERLGLPWGTRPYEDALEDTNMGWPSPSAMPAVSHEAPHASAPPRHRITSPTRSRRPAAPPAAPAPAAIPPPSPVAATQPPSGAAATNVVKTDTPAGSKNEAPGQSSGWSSGGNLMVGGGAVAAIGISVLLASGPLGWMALVGAGSAVLSGTAMFTFGGIEMATSGDRTRAQETRVNDVGSAMGSMLTPGGAVGAVAAGGAIELGGGDASFENIATGAHVGALLEGGYHGVQGIRSGVRFVQNWRATRASANEIVAWAEHAPEALPAATQATEALPTATYPPGTQLSLSFEPGATSAAVTREAPEAVTAVSEVRPTAPTWHAGEIKPIGSERAGWRQIYRADRTGSTMVGNASETGGFRVAVAGYDRETGIVMMRVRESETGGFVAGQIWMGEIGQLSPARLQEIRSVAGTNTTVFGQLVEPDVLRMMEAATGQEMIRHVVQWRGPDAIPRQLPLLWIW